MFADCHRARRYLNHLLMAFALCSVNSVAIAESPKLSISPATPAENVVFITLDGLRWEDVFDGANEPLIQRNGGVVNKTKTSEKYLRATAEERRERLMPFLWTVIAKQGVLLGNPNAESHVKVANSFHFSYPGYSEMLIGFADPKIDSNEKRYNENVTVLEWLNQMAGFKGQVCAVTGWDVFPFIINDQRSGVLVNSGWEPLSPKLRQSTTDHTLTKEAIDELIKVEAIAAQVPDMWDGFRYDYFTYRAADAAIRVLQPKVLFVNFGETDEWGHGGRYDLYLDAAQRNDQYIQQLWATLQSMEQYRDKTTLIVTTDHGRGQTDWRSHSNSLPGCDRIWFAAMGPSVAHYESQHESFTQSQFAATMAAALGQDFCQTSDKVAPPMPIFVGNAAVKSE